ncbi:MAG: hypothetical protein MK207_08625 [Saprospiraceae bacterium]|nr:hypothetical protein [Saprospiraceae bacterium]
MRKKIFLCLFFACLGITNEICFVAITNLINGDTICNSTRWSLTGKTYVWMLPIYCLIPLLAGPIIKKTSHLFLLYRLLLYTFLIFLIEFITGFLLEQLTGSCPWEYNNGWHILGYIRLDYLPAWMLFSYCIEYLYLYLEKNLNEVK